jgi:aspartokinase
LSSVLPAARARKPRAPPVGKPYPLSKIASLNGGDSHLLCSSSRLLAVFNKLKNIATPISSEEKQQELIEQAAGLIRDVCNDHVAASETFVKDPELRAALISKLRAECQELIEYIMATRRFNLEVNSRSKDRVISFGEKLSCLFMTTLLQDSVRLPPSPSRHVRTARKGNNHALE